eukprot:824233-Amphidinium_carterae.1
MPQVVDLVFIMPGALYFCYCKCRNMTLWASPSHFDTRSALCQSPSHLRRALLPQHNLGTLRGTMENEDVYNDKL